MFVVFLHHFFLSRTNRFHCSILRSTSHYQSNGRLHLSIENTSPDWWCYSETVIPVKKKTNWIHPRYTEPHAECLFFYSFNYYIFWVNHSAEQQWYMLVSRTHTSGGENEAIVCVCNLIVLRDFSDANSCNTWFDWVYDMTTVYLQNLFYVSIKINEPNVLSTFYISVWSAQPIR